MIQYTKDGVTLRPLLTHQFNQFRNVPSMLINPVEGKHLTTG